MSKDYENKTSASSEDSILDRPYPLAIVGFSCWLPDAASPEEYWQNIFNNRVSVKPVHAPRFPDVFYAPDPKREKKAKRGRSYSNLAALIDFERFCNDEVPRLRDEFARHGVGNDLLPKAPGHLLALKVALEALRSTGADPFNLPTSSIGLFCGLVSGNDSPEFAPVHPNADAFADCLNASPSFQALAPEIRGAALNGLLAEIPSVSAMGRDEFLSTERPHQLVRSIQSALKLTGAGFAFDSACSSSLLAFETARNYLQTGKLEAALVGGSTFFASSSLIHFTNASSCSATGVFPFDERADGLLSGDGCVFAVVKSLSKAVAAGDRILAVVRGIGFSSDGRGKSFWAPSSDGQTLALKRAFKDARYRSWSEFDRIEAHATSTQLGDATELQSLSSVMSETEMPQGVKIPITSVKANIGHILEAAGAASVLKTVLELSHELKLKQTSFEKPSSKFDWAASPLRVLTENEPWPATPGHIRKSCVQAFGVGGLDAQVIIEGAEGAANVAEQPEGTKRGRVAIIGAGCVLPHAFDARSFKERVGRGESGATSLPQDRAYTLFTDADRADANSLFYRARGCFIEGYDYDWKRHLIPPKHIKNGNPLQFMTLDAADQAILSAGYRSGLKKVEASDASSARLKVLDSHSTAVVVGTRSDSDFLSALNLELQAPVYQDRLEKALEFEGVSHEEASALGEEFFNLVYDKYYPCLKDETGGFTISSLASRITKTYDLMGGGLTLDAGNISSFTALKTAIALLERRSELRAVLCVACHRCMNREELKECEKYGVIPGEGAVAFLLKRVEDAQEDGDSILAVVSELEEERLEKNDAESARKKFAEFAAASKTLADVERPLWIETICDPDRDAEARVNADMKNFGATKSVDVFGETRPSARALVGDLRPGAGAVAVLNAILNMQESADNPRAVVSQWDRDGMVAQITLEKAPIQPKKATVEAKATVKPAESPTARSPRTDRVVFLFPGQGSQYAKMLTPILRALPEAREVRDELDAELKKLNYPTFNELAIENADALGVDVTATQLSLLVADTIVDRTLRRLGIVPDMIAGHSYGEYPAMVAAGTLAFADAARATYERCRIIDATLKKASTPSGMLSTNAPKDVIRKIFDRLRPQFGDDAFFVSNRNAPDNTIISATRPALAQIAEELKAEHCGSVILSVPAGYHSPLVADVRPDLGKMLAGIEFDFPKTPFLSGVSMRFESDPEVIRENLVEQMTKPVDFIEMMERAYRNGGRRFVEIGPKQVLTRLAAKILKGKEGASYYVCDYGVKGVEREFDASILEALRAPRVAVSVPATEPSEPTPPPTEQVQERPEPQRGETLPEDVVAYSGSPYEIGLARGRGDGDRIRRALRRYADVAGTSNEKLLPTIDAAEIARAQDVFGQSGYDELRGLAEGAGVPLAALIRHNLSAFPASREHIAEWGGLAKPSGGCSHFAGATLDGEFVHGGNIDAPISNILPNALASRIAVRRPEVGYASVSILLTGLIGSRGGVNERGLAATTCDLLDEVYRAAPKEGLHRGVVLQTILDRCATVEEALEFLKTTRLSGAKAIGLSDAQGATALAEYAGDERGALVVKRWFGANHAQTLKSGLDSQSAPSHSIARYERLRELLGADANRLARASADAFAVLRDEYDAKRANSNSRFRTLNMILRADNAFSWLFYRNAGVIRFQRTYSNAIEPEGNDASMVFSLKEIMPEYGATPVTSNPTQPIAATEVVKDPSRPSAQFNPILQPQDYLANIEADLAVRAEEKTITVRYEDRLVPTATPPSCSTAPQGRVLVLASGSNALALAFERELAARGGDARLVALLDRAGAPKSTDALSREIASLAVESFPTSVVILTSYDASESVFTSQAAWEQTRARGIAFPIVALQIWYKQALERKINLTSLRVVAATRMGGVLGVDGDVARPEDGAMMGLMRAFQFETYIAKGARTYAYCVDHEYDADVQDVARDLITELQTSAEFAEDVGYRSGVRQVMRMSVRAQEPAPRTEPATQNAPVWLVTGGRRGVTAELAYVLGTEFGAKLCLVGSSDPEVPHVEEALALDAEGLKELKKQITREALAQKQKPIEAWSRFERALETRKTLKRFQDAKIEVESYNCDLADFQAARELTRKLVAKHGRIDGVLFGAGFEKATLFEKCAEDAILRILDVKVASAVAILSAFDESNYPKTLVGMGSISGRLGSSGQVGYCVANNMLGKTLSSFARGRADCRALLIHWHPWDEVGMAVRPESRLVFESSGIPLMPLKEGLKTFVDELNGVRRPVEICQTDPGYYHWYAKNPYPYLTDVGLALIQEKANALRETSAEATQNDVAQPSASPDAPTRALITLDEYKRGDSCVATLGPAPQLDDPMERLGRFVPRLIETELPPDASSPDAWRGLYENEFALVVGDNELARALTAALNRVGVPADNLVPTPYDACEEDIARAIRARGERLATIVDLCGWTRNDPVFTEESLNQTTRGDVLFEAFLLRPVVRELRPVGGFARYNHMVATRFGGDFGLSALESYPEGGFGSGVAKGLRDELHVKENLYVPIKVVDHACDAPIERVVAHLLAELRQERLAIASGANRDPILLANEREGRETSGEWSPFDIETGYMGERRYVVRTIGLPHLTDATTSDWFESLKRSEPRDGAWLLVGGLRGITNANLYALAREVRPKKIWLVGSSDLEPIDAKYLDLSESELGAVQREMTRESLKMKVSPVKRWNKFHRNLEGARNLRAFQRLGIEIEYRACDSRFTDKIGALVREIEASGDRITGLVFGAGWAGRDNAIELGDPNDVVNGTLTKTNGLSFFLESLANHPLRFAVAFGSVSGRFGGNGQNSYTGQNDMSAKTIHAWRGRKPDCRFLCVEWGPWGDVGMAARPDVKGALVAAKILFLTKETGAPLFVNEFRAGLPEPEVLFVSWKYYDRFQPEVTSNPKRVLTSASAERATDKFATGRGVVIDGDSWEARELRSYVGECRPADASLYFITQPREYGALKAVGDARIAARREEMEKVMTRVLAWREARRGHDDDALVILGIANDDAVGPARDEGEEYFARASELEESGEYGQFEIALMTAPLDATPTRALVDAMLAEAQAEDESEEEDEPEEEPAPVASRSLVERVSASRDQIVGALTPDPSVAPYLLQHQLKGTPILPFVVALESFAETLADNTNRKRWTFCGIRAVNGLIFTQPRPYRLQTIATRDDDVCNGCWNMRLVGERFNASGKLVNDSFLYFTANCCMTESPDANAVVAPSLTLDLNGAVEWTPSYPGPNPNGFYHGPALQKLKRCYFKSETEAIGVLTAPTREELLGSESAHATLDAALLDAAFWTCGALNGYARNGKSIIPDSIATLRGVSSVIKPGETCYARAVVRERVTLPLGYTQAVFDFGIYNSEYLPIWEALGFCVTEI